MKINELSKELGVSNKELITYLKSKDFNVSSHMQSATDEMIYSAKEQFVNNTPKETTTEVVETTKPETSESVMEAKSEKVFAMDDLIPCRSVVPWKLNALSLDKNKIYHWEYYGDVDYLAYRDLQALRRTDYVTAPKFIIEDADLCYQWRRELGDVYKHYLNVEYPEEFFSLDDVKFKELLQNAPSTLKEVIKVTAMVMIKNENHPSVRQIEIIDEVLGTCLKEFL